MSFLQDNTCKFVIGAEKFHPIIHRQMRFILHFVAAKTYLCCNAKNLYLLVRNGQYWPPVMQTGTKSTDFYFIFIITCVQVEYDKNMSCLHLPDNQVTPVSLAPSLKQKMG